MILREAFRYQNYLSVLKETLVNFLYRSENIMKVVETHKYSSANTEKKDDIVERESEYNINEVIKLIDVIIEEKKAITDAISKAKKECEYDIDSLLEINKFNSSIISVLKDINGINSKESKTMGTDYKFNINGEQLSYKYPVESVSTINFDRNVTKGMAKTLIKNSSDVSNLIDKLNVTLEVDFEPKFCLDDKLEDILELCKK